MFKIVKLILISCCFFYITASYADDPQSQNLWWQATTATRSGANALQNQIATEQANQQAYQYQQHQQILQSLTNIQAQQKLFMDTVVPYPYYYSHTHTPTPLTNKPALDTNPWVKSNPWNATDNPYRAKQYPYGGVEPNTTQTTNYNNYNIPHNYNNPPPPFIYVPPPTNAAQQHSQQGVINIYK